MKLEGKVAIVTGAAQGIGQAIAFAFAKEGANVVVNDTNVELANKVADEIISMGRQALAVKADVSNSKEVNELVRKTLDNFKKIDVLVNNAGIAPPVPTEELTEAEWDRTMDVNLKGQFLCSQAVGRRMITQKQGKIINIASVGAHRAIPKLAAYCASKAGVLMLAQVLAVEWAKYNINVNAVSPGLTMTPLSEKVSKDYDLFKGRVEAIPLRRANKPEDIANAVLFLASSESDNVTGQVIIVDGGTCVLHSGYVAALRE